LWRYVEESGHRAGRLMGMGRRVSTVHTYLSVCLGHCDTAVEGEFTIYGKYLLVLRLERLRYLLLASYLSIFKSKPFPLRL